MIKGRKLKRGSKIAIISPSNGLPFKFPEIYKLGLENLEDEFGEFLKENASQLKAEFFLPKVVNDMIKEDQLEVIVKQSDDNWFGMTYPEDREVVVNSIQNLIKDQKYPNALWK